MARKSSKKLTVCRSPEINLIVFISTSQNVVVGRERKRTDSPSGLPKKKKGVGRLGDAKNIHDSATSTNREQITIRTQSDRCHEAEVLSCQDHAIPCLEIP